MDIVEIVGYLAMTFLVVSFIPKQIKKVRYINLIACLFFIAYGIMLGFKWPIIVSNGVVCLIQAYHLTSSLRHPKIFIKEFGDFLMPCHQHCLSVYILVQR